MVGKDTYLAFGSNGTPTTKVDRSTKFNDLKMPVEMASNETTTFGNSGDRSYEPGLRSRTISGSGIHDVTIEAHINGLMENGVTCDFDYCPVGNTTGNQKYSGKFFVTKYEVGAKVGDTIPFTFEAQITGAVTRATV